MHAKISEGNADRMDFVNERRPPEEAPLMDRVSTRLSIDCKRGYKAHRGSLESEIRIPMYV
jgi:hypothetical protein